MSHRNALLNNSVLSNFLNWLTELLGLVFTEIEFHSLGAETENALSENFDLKTGCLRLTVEDDRNVRDGS